MHSNPIAARVFLVVSEIVYYTKKKIYEPQILRFAKKMEAFPPPDTHDNDMEPDKSLRKKNHLNQFPP